VGVLGHAPKGQCVVGRGQEKWRRSSASGWDALLEPH
jgi:hypothetical protein